jgi:hypothetical protein
MQENSNDQGKAPRRPLGKRGGARPRPKRVEPDAIINEGMHDVIEALDLDPDDYGGGNPKHVRRLSAEEKKRAALALRLGGATYEQIGKAIGVDTSTASRYVSGIMKELKLEGAEELRRIQFMRLEHMLMLKWPEVQEKKDSAMNMALAIMDRQTRLLGLDSPVKSELSINSDVHINVAGDKDSFINSLRKAREQIVAHTMHQRALEAGEDIVEATLIPESGNDSTDPA